MIFRAIVAATVAFTFNAGLLHAQTFRGAIQGTVNDSSGSAVPNMQVANAEDNAEVFSCRGEQKGLYCPCSFRGPRRNPGESADESWRPFPSRTARWVRLLVSK